jgi:hypothetical protein
MNSRTASLATAFRYLPAALAVGLAACSSVGRKSDTVPCGAAAQWRAVSAGKPVGQCPPDPEIEQARYLAEQFLTLSRQLEALEAAGEITGSERLERVRLIRELEQIRGAAIIRGWEHGPAPG